MKRLALTIVMILLFSLVSTTTASNYTNVSVGEAKAMIDSNPSMVILDVRTLSEYNSGHIRNTLHIPVAQLGGRLDELDVDDEILVYCGSGGRSASASQLLVDNGFSHIYNMLGGITAWIGAGYPVYIKYTSIQNAINTANEGDTIYVSSGTYYENVLVNKSVSLQGENTYRTIIDGRSQKPYAVNVTANKVNISGFSIRNEEIYPFEWSSGIYVYSSHNNISHNIISNNINNGINLEFSSNNTITHNQIYLNHLYGIRVYFSTNNTISNNHVFLNQASGLYLVVSHNNTITGNNVTSNRDMGIWLMSSDYCKVSDNIVYNNTNGIYLTSNHIIVSHNNVSHPSPPDNLYGIYLRTASNCTVLKNHVSNHSSGIFLLLESNGNIISYNTVSDCSKGLSLVSHIENNSIFINTFSRTGRAIEILDSSHSNMLVWNNFVEYDDVLIGNDPPNVWDNGRWGNYWSNYNGSDLDDDGVGDTDLPWEGVDNYPLMNLFWNIGDVDHDFDVDIFDVVKAAGIYGSTSADPNWNPHCDIAEPYGIIDIFDLVMIANSYGEEYNP